MVADALAPCVARPSAAMILTVKYASPGPLWGRIPITSVIMWRNHIKCKYMFLFPLKNLACKGLRCCHVGWGNVSYKLMAIVWFFCCWSKVHMFCGWWNYWLNDDQQPVLQVFIQWVMPQSRHNKGLYDFTQNQFWPLRIVVCVCVYPCVHIPQFVNPELVDAITRDPFKPGSPNMENNLVKIPTVLGGRFLPSR